DLVMRIIVVCTMVAIACAAPKAKPESALVNEGSDVPASCCCKTIPLTAEKEIHPAYVMEGRMDCSAKHGDCVDDVQCNASQPNTKDTGVPPPVQPRSDLGPVVP